MSYQYAECLKNYYNSILYQGKIWIVRWYMMDGVLKFFVQSAI